jgi:hypothetical protein
MIRSFVIWVTALLLAGVSSAGAARVNQEDALPRKAPRRDSFCPYTKLLEADVAASGTNGVDVTFCDARTARLIFPKDPSCCDEEASSLVEWSNPSLQHRPLTKLDEEYFNNYTGSFRYARNVVGVLQGKSPLLANEDSQSGWSSISRPDLTGEVLRWDVGFATALNKLPDQAATLYRGQWETASVVRKMEAIPKGFTQGWFQSLTTNYTHAAEFMSKKHEPMQCRGRPGCISSGLAFPVIYQFNTGQAKDLRKWNPSEEELLFLPNTPFDILSVSREENDKLMGMSSAELSTWFRQTHEPLGAAGQDTIGPFAALAGAVEAGNVTGRTFVSFLDPYYYPGTTDLNWVVQLKMQGKVDYDYGVQVSKALKTRFKLPAIKGNYDIWVPNDLPYFFHVLVQDAS